MKRVIKYELADGRRLEVVSDDRSSADLTVYSILYNEWKYIRNKKYIGESANNQIYEFTVGDKDNPITLTVEGFDEGNVIRNLIKELENRGIIKIEGVGFKLGRCF